MDSLYETGVKRFIKNVASASNPLLPCRAPCGTRTRICSIGGGSLWCVETKRPAPFKIFLEPFFVIVRAYRKSHVWVFVQLIPRPTRTKNLLNKNSNIAQLEACYQLWLSHINRISLHCLPMYQSSYSAIVLELLHEVRDSALAPLRARRQHLHPWRQLYENRSSRKIDSRRLFSRD